MYFEVIQTFHRKIWQWWKDQIVEVPASDALCEFDCRKEQCSQNEWESCERRITTAAGELWPEPKPATRGVGNLDATPSPSAPQS